MLNEPSVQLSNTIMPRKQKEVWLAINQLIQEGLHPDMITNPIIGDRLEELGYKRGSGSDLSRYKNAWLTAYRSQQSTFIETPSPALLSDPIAQAVQALKTKLILESQEEMANIKKMADEKIGQATDKIAQSQQEAQRALDEAEKTQRAVESIRTQNIQLEKKLSELTTKLEHAQEQNEHLQIKHDKATKKCVELENLQTQQLQTFNKIYDSLKVEHRHTMDQFITTQENQRHAWILEKDQLKTETNKLRQQLEEVQTRLHSSQTQLERSNTENQLAKEKMNTLATLAALFETSEQEQAKRDLKFHSQISSVKKTLFDCQQKINTYASLSKLSYEQLLENVGSIETMLHQLDALQLKQLFEKLDPSLGLLVKEKVK